MKRRVIAAVTAVLFALPLAGCADDDPNDVDDLTQTTAVTGVTGEDMVPSTTLPMVTTIPATTAP